MRHSVAHHHLDACERSESIEARVLGVVRDWPDGEQCAPFIDSAELYVANERQPVKGARVAHVGKGLASNAETIHQREAEMTDCA